MLETGDLLEREGLRRLRSLRDYNINDPDDFDDQENHNDYDQKNHDDQANYNNHHDHKHDLNEHINEHLNIDEHDPTTALSWG